MIHNRPYARGGDFVSAPIRKNVRWRRQRPLTRRALTYQQRLSLIVNLFQATQIAIVVFNWLFSKLQN